MFGAAATADALRHTHAYTLTHTQRRKINENKKICLVLSRTFNQRSK